MTTTRGHILLVEDEPKLLRSYSDRLGAAGFAVTKAPGGLEAVHLLKARTFDAVLIDLVMPKVDGLSVLRHVRELGPDVPVVLMSDKAHRRSEHRAKAEGALEFLVKPIDGETLARAMAQAIRSRRVRVTFRNRRGEDLQVASFKATDVKNAFGKMLETTLRQGAIVITKHDDPKAVLLSWDEFEALTSARSRQLTALTSEFDALLARMQTARAREGMQEAFEAPPAKLGRAAVAAAGRRG